MPRQPPQLVAIRDQPPRRAGQLIVRKRLEVSCFFPERALHQAQGMRRDSLAAATDHIHIAAPQFVDLIHHIGLERRRKFVRDVGNVHATTSSVAQSIPATVNNRPITNWYVMSTKNALTR